MCDCAWQCPIIKTSTASSVHEMRLLHHHSFYHWLWCHLMTFHNRKQPYLAFKNNTGLTNQCTMGQNQVILRHGIIHFTTSVGVSEVSERANEWAQRSKASKASEASSEASSPEQANEWVVRANGRASGPVLMSRFLFVPDHSAMDRQRRMNGQIQPLIEMRTVLSLISALPLISAPPSFHWLLILKN